MGYMDNHEGIRYKRHSGMLGKWTYELVQNTSSRPLNFEKSKFDGHYILKNVLSDYALCVEEQNREPRKNEYMTNIHFKSPSETTDGSEFAFQL